MHQINIISINAVRYEFGAEFSNKKRNVCFPQTLTLFLREIIIQQLQLYSIFRVYSLSETAVGTQYHIIKTMQRRVTLHAE